MANTKNKDCMAYKNKLSYIAKYNKEKACKKLINFSLVNETDKAILQFLETKKPLSPYVKKLILEDMNK